MLCGSVCDTSEFDKAANREWLADFGYDADRIGAEWTKIEAFDQTNHAQKMAKYASQQATHNTCQVLAFCPLSGTCNYPSCRIKSGCAC